MSKSTFRFCAGQPSMQVAAFLIGAFAMIPLNSSLHIRVVPAAELRDVVGVPAEPPECRGTADSSALDLRWSFSPGHREARPQDHAGGAIGRTRVGFSRRGSLVPRQGRP